VRRRSLTPRVAILIATVLVLIAVAVTATVKVLHSSDERLTFLRLDPTRVVFDETGPREALLTVRNTSAAVGVVLHEPRIKGPGVVAFSVDGGTCRAALDPGRSCQMTVRFAPLRSGTFVATLVVQTDMGPAPDVELVGTAQF
jgi:hypothetical protein